MQQLNQSQNLLITNPKTELKSILRDSGSFMAKSSVIGRQVTFDIKEKPNDKKDAELKPQKESKSQFSFSLYTLKLSDEKMQANYQ